MDFLVGAAVVLVWIVLLGLFASVFTLGVQLIAAPWREDLALRAGRALAQAGVAPELTNPSQMSQWLAGDNYE